MDDGTDGRQADVDDKSFMLKMLEGHISKDTPREEPQDGSHV